jgi:DNA polymerase
MGRKMNITVRKESLIRALRFYEALGFDRLPLSLPDTLAGSTEEKAEALERLRHDLGDCMRCKLSRGRANIVFGEGNPGAELMFIGEGPGREEDLQGRPFVGDAGKLLTRLINRMGFRREDVYIGNIIKCRPKDNRDPEEDEIKACMPFISAQAGIIRPKAIMALGRISAHTLLGSKTPISRLRGRFSEFENIPVMPTFHPAYLLRNRSEKIKVWEDALKVLKKLGREPS